MEVSYLNNDLSFGNNLKITFPNELWKLNTLGVNYKIQMASAKFSLRKLAFEILPITIMTI
jgi:hypothetical protein